MRSDKDIEELIGFLDKAGAEYAPDNPGEKNGMGHGIEHLKGTVYRTEEIGEIINGNPQKYDGEYIDKTVSTTIAVMHDIGNTVNREMHADIGFGVINGSLSVEDVLAVPSKLNLTEENKDNILKASNGLISYNDLSDLEKTGYVDAIEKVIVFDAGYNGIKLEDIPTDRQEVSAAVTALYQDNIPNDLHYNPNLRGLTEEIHNLFTNDEIKTMAEAVQDHNIDFDGSERYTARSIYGMLASDSDKDDVIQTFMIRCLEYSINECPRLYEGFVSEDGKIDMDRCLDNILVQAWERYRMPLTSEEAQYQKIPEEALRTYGIDNIKGVLTGEQAEEYAKTHPDSVLKESNGTVYCVRQELGDDIYSQLDAKYDHESGFGEILSLRMDFIEDAMLLADATENPDDELPDYMSLDTIKEYYEMSPSTEYAVDLFEESQYSERGETWEDMIRQILDPEWQDPVDEGESDMPYYWDDEDNTDFEEEDEETEFDVIEQEIEY